MDFFEVGCLYQSKGGFADVVVFEGEILGWVTLKGGKWKQGRQWPGTLLHGPNKNNRHLVLT